MARVLLATLNAKYVHSSLALRYLRAAVEDAHDVTMLEFTIHDPVERVLSSLFEAVPDVVGLSCYIWNIEETGRLLPLIKKILPHTLIVLGGPEVSYDCAYFLERFPATDVIVAGEGEEALRELLDRCEWGDRSFSAVRGLYVRDESGRIYSTGKRGKVDLERLASPYTNERMDELRDRIVYFETSRGCPFSCQFCLSSIESGVRYFPLARVKEDLARLIDAGVRQIKFLDRTFNLRRDYAMEIFRFLIADPGRATFHFEITGDILKPDIVRWLCDNVPAGLFRFEIGVQSTNDITNAIVKRRQDFSRLSHTVRMIAEAGNIMLHLDLIAGLPEEDYTTFKQTFNDAYALRPDELQLGFLKLLRGTGLRTMADRFGYVFMDTAPYETLSNHIMPFRDVLRLKQLEDILEKYYNSGRFPHIMQYATDSLFNSPFDFFQAFGSYWHGQGWSRIGHQPLDLVRRLIQFLEREGKFDDVAGALLRADHLLREKVRPRSLWWNSPLSDGDRRRLFSELLRHRALWDARMAEESIHGADKARRVIVDEIPAAAHRLLFPELKLPAEGKVRLLYVFPADAGNPLVFSSAQFTSESPAPGVDPA
ncbi:MAG: B12-binding domain-containing radical SAM protein [Bacilli bacterium]